MYSQKMNCKKYEKFNKKGDFLFLFKKKNKILVENILKSNFEGLSPFQITQILRGKLFFFLDNLMTYDYDELEKEDMVKILEFIFLYIHFTCQYLEKFKGLYTQVIFLFLKVLKLKNIINLV